MNTSSLTARLLLGLAASGALTAGAFGHEYSLCDNGVIANVKSNPIPLRVTSDQFPPGDQFTLGLVEVIQGWSNTASAMQYACVYEGPGDGKNAFYNDVNEVYWTEDGFEKEETNEWVGLCLMRMQGAECDVVETDVVFNDIRVHFTASTDVAVVPTAFGEAGSLYSFQTVAYHELGHAQALDHTTDAYSVMGHGPHHHVNGSSAIAYPGEDAVTGSIGLYGAVPGGMTDLALAPFKYAGVVHTPEGDYAENAPVGVSMVGAGPGFFFDGDVVHVYPGTKYEMEVTVENLGTTSESTQIGFYLSYDSDITTGDLFLGEVALDVHPDQPTTITSPVLSLPENLGVGEDVWLGAVIDPEQAIAEAGEWNNRTYVKAYVELWKPDLLAEFVSGPDVVYTGGSAFVVASKYTNVGGPLNGLTSYELQLVDLNSGLPAEFSATTVLAVNSVTPGHRIDIVSLPDGFPVGDYAFALKVADVAGGEGDDLWEEPNFVLGDEVTVALGPTEIVAAEVVGPALAGAGTIYGVGDDVPVQFTVDNIGSPMQFPVVYSVVLSLDEVIEPGDWSVSFGEVWSAGTYDVIGTLPDLPHGGTYHWGLMLGSAGFADDPSNNVLLAGSLAFVESSDLAPSSYVDGPATTSPGALVSLAFAFDPIGDGPNECTFVLVPAAQVSHPTKYGPTGAITLATGTYSGAPAQVKVMIPGSVPSGDYHFGLILDDANPWSKTGDRLVIGSAVHVVNAWIGG